MSIYTKIYHNLCKSGKELKEYHKPGSNLHKHHIIPRHTGGADDESNYTYLTIREHQIAHFLLWKIYKNVNDLRSMHMLGANLTYKQRSIIGKWCVENKIGIHGYSSEERAKNGMISYLKNLENQTEWAYWASPEGRAKRASMGGKASLASGNNKEWLYWMSPEGRAKRSSMGALSHKGKKCMYKPGDTTFIRVKPEDIDQRLLEGYIFGSPWKPNKGRKFGPKRNPTPI